MNNKKININFVTVVVFLSMTVGLNGCSTTTHHGKSPRIRVQEFVKNIVVNGKIAFKNKVTMQDMEVIKCGSNYKEDCPSAKNGFTTIGSQKLTVSVTAFQKETNSVDCFILIEIPDYAPIRIAWHEEGDTCSAGQQM